RPGEEARLFAGGERPCDPERDGDRPPPGPRAALRSAKVAEPRRERAHEPGPLHVDPRGDEPADPTLGQVPKAAGADGVVEAPELAAAGEREAARLATRGQRPGGHRRITTGQARPR